MDKISNNKLLFRYAILACVFVAVFAKGIPHPDSIRLRTVLPPTPILPYYQDFSNVPWRHHVDFDELHPGEEMIALETAASEPIRRHSSLSSHNHHRNERRQKRRERRQRRREHKNRRISEMEGLSDNYSPHPLLLHMFNGSSFLASNMSPFGRVFDDLIFEKPWWLGENVCFDRVEEDEGSTSEADTSSEVENFENLTENEFTNENDKKEEPFFSFKISACENLHSSYKCVTHLMGGGVNSSVTTTYKCCNGYILDKQAGKCQKGKFTNVVETIEEIGGKEFMRLVRSVGLEKKLATETLTLFVPDNVALSKSVLSGANEIESNSIESFLREESIRRKRSILTYETYGSADSDVDESNWVTPEIMSYSDEETWRRNALLEQDEWQNQVAPSPVDNGNLRRSLLNHMTSGKLSTDDFVDEKVIYSEDKGSQLRLNTWNIANERTVTINCARLTSINHQCSNGMVHLVDRVIKPTQKSTADIVATTPELTTLKSMLEISGLYETFKDENQHLTLFAPTNKAFELLGESMLKKLLNGDPCLQRILRHHIMPITFCTCVIPKQGQIKTIDHRRLNFERDFNDDLYINGSRIVTRDIMTTNGVVHVIDAVILSEEDEPASSALKKAGLTGFLDLVASIGMTTYLDELSNVTIFAPDNEAIAELPDDILRNRQKVQEIISYHISPVEKRACSFRDQQLLPNELNKGSIRVGLYANFPFGSKADITAQCGRLKKLNINACNGVIHGIDRVLLPMDLNIVQTLKSQPDFKIFSRLLEENIEILPNINEDNPYTVFAPTDATFYSLPKEELQEILEDQEKGRKVLARHIIQDALCCTGIAPNIWLMTKHVRNLDGCLVAVYRESNGQVVFGDSKITTCDLTASDGIVHTIDKVFTGKETDRSEVMRTLFPTRMQGIVF